MATKESIAYATPKQKEQCVAGILSAAGDGARMALEELSSTNSTGTSEEFQKQVIEVQGEINVLVRETVRDLVNRKIAQMVQGIVGILKLISGGEEIEVSETDGTETIAEAREVFTWGIDGDFQRWGTNVPSKPTPKAKAQVFEMVGDGDFKTIFNIPTRTLDSLAWEQSQVVDFVRKHKKWLRTGGYATFFLFKVQKEGEETKFFVAFVSLGSGCRPGVDCSRFDSDGVWYAEYRRRIVIPQPTLES